jgi:uncharacterized protein YbjT (DUF2867 family)
MTVLVTGATGTLGGAVAAELTRRGHGARALVRDVGRAASLLPERVTPVLGDLGDPASVRAALDGVEAALYVSPHDPSEVEMAQAFISACEDTGTRLVFVGAYVDGPNAFARWAMRTMFGLMLPHYRGKLRIGQLMTASKARPVVLSLTNYFQNDELIREDILAGAYPLPLSSKGVNRIDVRDVAELAVKALTDPSFGSGAYGLMGPRSISGAESAAIWEDELGRRVVYHDGDDDWPRMLGRRLSGQKLKDFTLTYKFLAKHGVPTDQRQLERTAALLGRPPRTYETYVAETRRRWARAG